MKKQQGVAAIILVLILIPLFGSVFFALEGTRYIQKKTRLADAAEAAALAVTDENPKKLTIAETNKKSQSLTQLKNEDDLASAYINSYVRNINKDTDKIIITPEIVINKNSNKRSYYQYNINVTTTHNSWFFSKLIPSFKETQSISANSLARNYPKLVGDQPIDLVFVADFSGSMQGNKIKSLKKSIKIISNEILSNGNGNGNRIAFTAFSDYTQSKYKNKQIYTQKYWIDDGHWVYNGWGYDWSEGYWEDIPISTKILPESIIASYWRGKYDYLNIVNTFINHKNKVINNGYRLPYNFYNISLTNNSGFLISSIESMSPKGSTSAYEGIMRGAQLLNDGNKIEEYNKRKKILILLSDGQESDQFITNSDGQIIGNGEYKLKQLVINYKLCDKIRKNFSTDNNKMFMGMIGIGYQASDNDVFHKCFDENIYNSEYQLISESNIIDVDDLSTLTDKIKELIHKGQQTDGISKLSDGQN